VERRQLYAIILGFVAVFVPCIVEWEAPGALSTGTSYAIAALGGAVAGRLLVPGGERIRAHLVAMAGGLLAAVGAFALTTWWVEGRESVWNVELVLANALGAVPGVLLGTAGYQRVRRRDEPVPTATAREK
jgi:hypothetical protein